MTAPVSVSCSKQTKSLTQTGLRSISGIGTDRRACIYISRHLPSGRQTGSNPSAKLVGARLSWRNIAITL